MAYLCSVRACWFGPTYPFPTHPWPAHEYQPPQTWVGVTKIQPPCTTCQRPLCQCATAAQATSASLERKLSAEDVERIAKRVVGLLREARP